MGSRATRKSSARLSPVVRPHTKTPTTTRMPDASVEIVEYSPHWADLFVLERQVISEALAQWLVGEPEHIGSTAVPGLAAKPVIDIMAPVATLVRPSPP